MSPERSIGAFALLVLGCESGGTLGDRTTDRTDNAQVGSNELTTLLRESGSCALHSPGSWTYSTGTQIRATVIHHANAPDVVSIEISNENGEFQGGHLILSQKAAFWSHSRDMVPSNQVGPAQRTQTLEDGRAEWNSPRGQLAVLLARRAIEVCMGSQSQR
jgi:hypothetical protein